jgi:hypothetical protein
MDGHYYITITLTGAPTEAKAGFVTSWQHAHCYEGLNVEGMEEKIHG